MSAWDQPLSGGPGLSLLTSSRATRSTKTGTKFRTGEPLMSLCHHRTHLVLRDLRELFTESFDDLIQLPNLMGSSGVRHDVIMTGRRASPAQSLSEPGQG